MKMPRKKESISTEIKGKLALMFLLLICLLMNIVWKAIERNEQQTDTYVSEMDRENISEIETKKLITNLEEFAVPLIEENAILLNEGLVKYSVGIGKKISEAEIFYVAVSAEKEDSMDFYVKLLPEGTIVSLTYYYADNSVVAEACPYTEDEVRAEIWNEGAPAIRDVQ